MLGQEEFFNLDMPGAFAATYWPNGGDKVETIIFIDENVEFYPGDVETAVVERRTEVTFRMDHVSSVMRDDCITTGDKTYIIKDTIDNDGFALRVSVK